MTKLSNLNPNVERRGGVVVSIKDFTPTATPESIKARKTVIEILKRSGYDQYRTDNEQWNARLKKLSGDGSCEEVISNHCTVNPKDVELLEGMYRAAQEARKRRIESKEYKEKMINLITNKGK